MNIWLDLNNNGLVIKVSFGVIEHSNAFVMKSRIIFSTSPTVVQFGLIIKIGLLYDSQQSASSRWTPDMTPGLYWASDWWRPVWQGIRGLAPQLTMLTINHQQLEDRSLQKQVKLPCHQTILTTFNNSWMASSTCTTSV